MLLLEPAILALDLPLLRLKFAVRSLPLLAGCLQILLLCIKLIVLVLQVLNLSVERVNTLKQLGLLSLEHAGFAFLVLLSPHKRINLDQVLLILLLESFEL